MKPHITKQPRTPYWKCISSGPNMYIRGIGKTPKAAYAEWLDSYDYHRTKVIL